MTNCRSRLLDYEKKSHRITWLRCIKCHDIVGWLEDNTPIIEGEVIPLSYKEKEKLK